AGACLASLIPSLSWISGGGGANNVYCYDCGQRPLPPRVPVNWTNTGSAGSALLDFLIAAAEKACPALVIPNPCDPECLPKLFPAVRDCFLPENPFDPDPPCWAEGVANCANDALHDRTYNGAVDCASGGFKCWFDFCINKNPVISCVFKMLE